MKSLRGLISLVFVYAFFCLLLPQEAYAYIDPGSGSYFLQFILAGLLAASFMIKTFWRSIGTFLANLFSKRRKDGKKSC